MKLTAIVPIFGPTYMSRQLFITKILEASEDIHLILICDSFDQETKRVLQDLVLKKKKRTIEILEGDYGNPGSARNAALGLVSTNWFCFWDSDDEPDPSGYLRMIERAEASNFKIAKGKYEIAIYKKNGLLHEKKPVRLCKSLDRQLVDPGLWRYVFSRKIYGDLRFPPLRMGEDQDYLVQALIKGEEIYFENETIYCYRVGFNSQLTREFGAFRDLNASLAFLLETYKENSYKSDYKVLIVISYLKQILSTINIGNLYTLKFLWREHQYFLTYLFIKGELFRPIYILLNEKVRRK